MMTDRMTLLPLALSMLLVVINRYNIRIKSSSSDPSDFSVFK